MKKLFSILSLAVLIYSCSNGQSQNTQWNLSASDFASKIKELPSAPILDVRSPEEFSSGHLEKAVNSNWNGDTFNKDIASLDKSKPVFVYCLSGGRSSSAAAKMRSDGFKQVYEMDGGLMKWRSVNLPEISGNKKPSNSMSMEEYNALLNSDKLVLIDFYADWCAPCKKMQPYLNEISTDMADKVRVVRINADENQALCKELKIDALPVLQLYKNKNLIWKNVGFIEKAEVVKQLK